MTINGSPNFTDFNFSWCIDLSDAVPTNELVDLSTYTNAGFLGIVFNIFEPSGLLFYEGDWSLPDIVVENGSKSINLPTFGALSYGTYKIQAWIKDQNGIIYQWQGEFDYKQIEVCKPNSLEGASGYYGGMDLEVVTDCNNNRICFTDRTPKVYKGIAGSLPYETSLEIIYPPDPNTFVQGATQLTTLLPSCYTITQNGRYQFRATRIVTYQLGDDTCIILKYQFIDYDYKVQCNVDLCELLCDYVRLIQKFDDARCAGDTDFIAEWQPKLTLINSKFIQFEEDRRCGIDVTGLIDDIATLGGFDCSKCFPSTIIPNPLIINNGVWSLVIPCGDLQGNIVQEGSNVELTLQDKSYFIQFDAASQAYLSVERVVSDCNVNFVVTLDLSSITDSLCKVKVSADDECCEYLIDKFVSENGTLNIEEVSDDTSPDDGCKKVNIEIPIPEWVALPFQSDFANTGGANQIGEYRLWSDGTLEVRGGITASNYPTSQTIVNLPYAPDARIEFPINVNNLGTYFSGVISISSTGQMVLLVNTSGWTGTTCTFHLSVVRFPIA